MLGPQMKNKEIQETRIRNIMNEIGRLQWVKNKALEELRDNKHRWQEEKKLEKEGMADIENKLRQKNELIDQEKLRQQNIIQETKKNTLLIYQYINGVLQINSIIDQKVHQEQLPARIQMVEDRGIVEKIISLRDQGQENEGFDQEKKKFVIQSALFLEKKLTHLFRDVGEKFDLNVRLEQVRQKGLMTKHMIRNYNDMIYHSV